MKLVVFCLFAVCYFSLANALQRNDPVTQRRKLGEILSQLSVVRKNQQHSEKMLNTPPQNIEDCCSLAALQCFRANLNVQFNITVGPEKKLYKSLQKSITESALNFCTSGNVHATCQDCTSHPKENVTEFFNRLESFIQKAFARLIVN